ncbi:MAG: ABC transporter substrate-binding protein [Ruminococcaceae bacterium]|nr:ABC transporter substrate-binding protein [Oscillospiraceae bacterium]
MKKFISLVIVLGLILTLFASCKTQDTDELVKISLSEVAHSVFYAPQYAAMELGFFEEEGIELELINGQGADKVMTSVVSGQVQIGLAGPEASIYVYNEGREDHAVVFAQLTQRDGAFLVGRTKEENFAWENVKGKYIIGGRKGGVPEMTLEYVLNKNGIVPNKDVTVDTSVQFALMAGAFTGGTGDYVALFEPTASMLEKEGKGYVLCSIGEQSGEIPYTAYFANKSYIEENSDIIEKFTRAIYKGQKWVEENEASEIAKAIVNHFPDTSLEILTMVAQRYKDIDAWSTTPVMKKEAFDLLQTVMEQAGELSKRAPFENIVDNSFAQKAVDNK